MVKKTEIQKIKELEAECDNYKDHLNKEKSKVGREIYNKEEKYQSHEEMKRDSDNLKTLDEKIQLMQNIRTNLSNYKLALRNYKLALRLDNSVYETRKEKEKEKDNLIATISNAKDKLSERRETRGIATKFWKLVDKFLPTLGVKGVKGAGISKSLHSHFKIENKSAPGQAPEDKASKKQTHK